MPSPQAGLSPQQLHQAAAPTPRHPPHQPEQYQDEEEDDADELEDGGEDVEWYAEAGAAAEAAPQELLLQEQAEKQAEQEKAAKAAAKKAAKKKVGCSVLHTRLNQKALPADSSLPCCLWNHPGCISKHSALQPCYISMGLSSTQSQKT